MQSLFDFTLPQLEAFFKERGQPTYRAGQLFGNVYKHGQLDYETMTDLPRSLRSELESVLELKTVRRNRTVTAGDNSATKVLWALHDGREIESVLMRADYGDTICFSTQVGCAFRCSFCVTGKMGRIRNLTAGEIVAQVHALKWDRPDPDRAVNLVAMGMGEPMDNLDALMPAIAILQEDHGLNIAPRRITVSTVGVVPGIQRITQDAPNVALALSLNATTNEVRTELMPINKKYPIETLIPALEEYGRISRHRVTLEYVLIRGLNDTIEDADRLGAIAERFPSKVNVIPFNPSDLFPYERPTDAEVDAFARRLWSRQTKVTVRYSKGLEIFAACGQLGYDQVKANLAASS